MMDRLWDISAANMVALMKPDTPLAIIGDGLAGAMLVWHLNQLGRDMQQITLFGTNSPGLGKAYGGIHPDLRLNVRDNLMNVTFDGGFARWAKTNIDDDNATTDSGMFFRRRDFGRYVEHLVAPVMAAGVTQIKAQVTQLIKPQAGTPFWRLITPLGETTAAQVVLALGNPTPQPPFEVSDDRQQNGQQNGPGNSVIDSPWYGDWPDTVDPDAEVAIIGSGLTAMDALLILSNRNHQAPIHLISPRAALPPRQAAWQPQDAVDWPKLTSAAAFSRFFLAYLADDDWNSARWQESFESLRGGISAAWQSLPTAERQRLLGRFASWWQMARYRAGPQTSDAAAAMLNSGQLRLIEGRAGKIHTTAAGQVAIDLGDRVQNADQVILAIGAGRDVLMMRMAADGVVAGNDHGTPVDHRLRVTGDDCRPIDGLYAIGPQTAFSRGDIIGAAGVSREARLLAETLMEDAA